ncbi:MAG: CapA family protein [Propionibacteriales bacterium]|nr:CapA family protein [Propionibacteriales bacterium]
MRLGSRCAAAYLVVILASCTTTGEPASEPPETTTAVPSPSPGTGSPGERPTEPHRTPDPRPPREFTVVMAGDVLLHDGLWVTARRDATVAGRSGMDFRPLLRGMRAVVDGADLAVCHLEVPLAPRGGPYSGYPIFSGPPQIVPALAWAGFDACTTASNHSVDQGLGGIRRTLDTLDAHQVAHAGTARTPGEARRPVIVRVGRARVGLVSQTYGVGLPVERPWSVQVIDTADILRRARAARAAGADVVLVGLHWGLEYQSEPTPEQRSIARRLLRSAAVDLLYGHHAHVAQPFERIGGKWVAYGLGNMVAQQETDVTGVYEGVTARFTFRERRGGRFAVHKAEYIPTYITPYDPGTPRMRLLRTTRALETGHPDASARALSASLARVNEAVNLLGARSHGLRLAR